MLLLKKLHRRIDIDSWRGDLKGGLVAALSYFPPSMAWGILAFAPLGPDFISMGVLAGLYSSIITGTVAALYGGMPTMQTGARSAGALILGALFVSLVKSGHIDLTNSGDLAVLFSVAFMAVALSGIIQIVFAWLNMGKLIKFIPYPIILGFVNSTAVLTIAYQIWPLLDLPRGDSLLNIPWLLADASAGSLLFGMLTFAIIWYIPKISSKWPAPVIGLIIATALYHVLSATGLEGMLGGTLGTMPTGLPSPDKLIPLFSGDALTLLRHSIPIVIVAAISMALIGAIESLLMANTLENMTEDRANGRRILVGLGLSNFIVAQFGGIAGSGTPTRSIPAVKAGSKTDLATIISSGLMLFALLVLTPVLQYIPQAAISGLMIYVAIQILDKWTLRNLKNLQWRNLFRHHELSSNILLILAIVIISLSFDLIMGVMCGILFALLLFVTKMSRSVIKFITYGSQIHSNTFRHHMEREYLQKHGHEIAVIQLEGPIFFGSAESIRDAVEKLTSENVNYFILDMKAVRDIDLTGINIIQSIYSDLDHKGLTLVVSHVEKERRSFIDKNRDSDERRQISQRRVWRSFEETNSLPHFGDKYFFQDVDRALEYCEEQLLKDMPRNTQDKYDVFSEDVDLFRGLIKKQIESVKDLFVQCTYAAGSKLIQQGDTGDSLVLIEDGLVDICVRVRDSENRLRIGSYSSGTVVGEMALLDGKPRSADVNAVTDVTCYSLNVSGFNTIKQQHPDIAFQMLTNLCLLFAERLRNVNNMLGQR